MPGSINPESGIYRYAADDPRTPMHDVLNLLADSVHDAQRTNLAEQSQLADLIAALQVSTAAAFARSGLSSDWNQTTGGTVPLSRTINVSGGLRIENNGIRVLITGSYQLSFGARANQANSSVWRTAAVRVNGADIGDAVFDASLNGVAADLNFALPLQLEAGDLVTIYSTASSNAWPSTWKEDRTRFALVRL